MNFIDIVLAVVGVGYLLVRRMIGDIVQVKSLLVLPVVLTGIGVLQLDRTGPLDVATVAFIVVGIASSVVIGAVRGLTVHLAPRRDELWMRYRASTVGLWVLNVAVKAALYPVEVAISHGSTSAVSHSLLLSIGLGILAESGVVLLRAVRHDGVVVWEKGKDGTAHRASPAFDRARAAVRAERGAGLRDVVSTVKRDR